MSSAGPASSSPTADTTRGANVHTSRQQEPSAAADARGTTLVDDIVEVSRSWANRLVPTAETWYRLNMTLGLKRLQELIQGTSSLTDDPVWLLGLWYGVQDADSDKSSMTPELHQLLLDDLNSRFWFTYRSNFPTVGRSSLTSDVGWGCTLRSGQMLLAEAIARCWWGRGVRFAAAAEDPHEAGLPAPSPATTPQQQQPQHGQQQASAHNPQQQGQHSGVSRSSSGGRPDQQALLQLFVDRPGPQAPFSIHNLCSAGATHGVVAGQWLGPWVLCKALAAAAAVAAAEAASSLQQQGGLGLTVHVACDPGGGAPELDPDQLQQLLPSSRGSSASEIAAQQEDMQQSGVQQPQRGLLLLVPLTLGVGKVNERYLPQLSSVLSFPQSVGIVGGRPGASLFFVGVQGGAVLYLDPHEVQEMPVLPRDMGTFHCSLPRLMPLTAIDPSLAIGFYCADSGDLQDLLSRLQQLASTAGGAPLMTVQQAGRTSAASGAAAAGAGASGDAAEGGKADDWELV